MSQLIANRYKPLVPVHDGFAAGEPLGVRDTWRGLDASLRVVATPETASEHWLVQLRVGALARLRHPALQAVHDAGHLADGSLFLVESARRGRPVTQLMPLPPDRVGAVFLGLCQGLRALHGRGFAHGALSADRVSVDDEFAPQLAQGPRLGLGARLEDDLAQLGRLFFCLLTGREPQDGETLPSAAATNVPPHQDALVHRLLTGGCERLDDVFLLLPVVGDETVPLPLGEAPLAGRDAAFAQLSEAWHTARTARRGRLLAVIGEPGVGKSRLIEEAVLGWRLGGTAVLIGRSGGDESPYRPWADILKQALPIARQRCPEAFGTAAPVLSALLGDLGVQPAPALEPRQDKLRLQGAIADLLAALAGQGLVLVLEDWARADALSRETLGFVFRALAEQPALVLTAGPAAEELQAETLTLAPLARPALALLARDLLGGRPLATDALAAIAELTGGNPQLLSELLAHLARAGQLRLGEDGWAVTGDLRDRPYALEDLYRTRLDRLAPGPLEAARLAAVLGTEGELRLLGAIWPHGPEALAAALEALRDQGLLETSGAYFRFNPPTWVTLLQAGAAPADWQAWHDRAATGLEALAADNQAPSDWVLRHAAHALAGTRPDRAVQAALAAGETLCALNDPTAARRFLTQGLALWESLGGATGAHAGLELAYRRLLGDVLRLGGEYKDAVALYERACALATAGGDTELAAYLLTSQGKCLQMNNLYSEAEAAYQSSLGLYETLGAPLGKLRALNSLARVQMIVGNRAAAETLYLQALEEAEAAGATIAEGEALGALGLYLVSSDPGRIQQGIAYLERSVTLRRQMGDKIGLNDAYSLLGNAHLTLGQFPAAKDAFVRNQRLCFECGLTDDEIFALINLAIVGIEMGEFRRARDLAIAAVARSRRSGSQFCLSLSLALEGLSRAYMAELTDVMSLMDQAMAIARELKNKYLEINILVWHAEALLLFGRLTDAVDVAHAATALMAELGYREFEPRLLVIQAEVHGRLGEREEARELLTRAHTLARENQNVGMTGRVLKTLAWLCLQEKTLLPARDYARQALDVAEAVGATYLAGEAHWLIGEVDLAAEQPEQAVRELLKALDAGESTESPHLQALALFCLARASDEEFRTREYLFQARDMLRAQLAQLDELHREDYLALAERWRVDRGELVFAEKARAQKGQPDLGPEGRLYFERMTRFALFAAELHGMALDAAMASLLALMEAERVCVLMDTDEGRRLVAHARGGAGDDAAEADRRVLETLWGSHQVFYQPFVSEDPRFAGLYPVVPASLLAASFRHGVVLAVREGATFSQQEVATLELVGAQFAVAIANAARLGVRL
jgi:tetratricopeptide (TPR) repeat protein